MSSTYVAKESGAICALVSHPKSKRACVRGEWCTHRREQLGVRDVGVQVGIDDAIQRLKAERHELLDAADALYDVQKRIGVSMSEATPSH